MIATALLVAGMVGWFMALGWAATPAEQRPRLRQLTLRQGLRLVRDGVVSLNRLQSLGGRLQEFTADQVELQERWLLRDRPQPPRQK